MGIVAWIVVGLIAGWLTGLVMKGSGYGLIGDLIVGIVGALLGGFVASAVFGLSNAVNGINFVSILVAVLGAIILVLILRAISGNRARV